MKNKSRVYICKKMCLPKKISNFYAIPNSVFVNF